MTKAQKEIVAAYKRVSAISLEASMLDVKYLRRAALTLHRWYEHECNGTIQRDEVTGKPYWYSATTHKRIGITSDRERGAEKTIADICARLGLHYFLQPDPRGGTLYVSKTLIEDDSYNGATFVA